MFLGTQSSDNYYVISIDAARGINNSHDSRDYITLNEANYNGGARLDEASVWDQKTYLLTRNNEYAWYRYEATMHTIYDPEIDVAVAGWGELLIDNVVVKDRAGNLLFSENFEESDYEAVPTSIPTVAPTNAPTPEPTVAPSPTPIPTSTPTPTDGEHVLTTKNDGWLKDGNMNVTFECEEYNGGHRLFVSGHNASSVGTYRIALPAKAVDNEYHITYDHEKPSGAGNDVSIDLVGNNIYGPGKINTLTDGVHIVSGSGDYLYIACVGWGGAYIDNIVVKDKNGKTLFTEDFENFDTKYSYYTYDTKLQGLAANGYSNKVILSWRNPNRDDIAAIKIFENGAETLSSQLASIDTASGHANIVEVTDSMTSGSTHTYDVRMYTTDNKIYHNEVTGKEGAQFISRTKTASGQTINGWRVTYADGASVKALGKIEFDTNNYAEGTRSLHINPNFIEEGSTNISAGYNDGARINLDTSAFGIKSGKTYRLTWKQKGHNVPHYYVLLVMDDHATNIGAMTTNQTRVTTPWQEREIEFTVDSVGSLPTLRFEFSGGADDFWLDDIELVEVGGTDNILENGTFENTGYYIHDAELSVVEQQGNDYVYVSTPSALTGNILLKSSVKIENFTENEPVGVDIYTVLFKDGRLVKVDKTSPLAVKGGETTGSSVISIPSVDDGDYKVAVLVWESGTVNPIKSVTSLAE